MKQHQTSSNPSLLRRATLLLLLGMVLSPLLWGCSPDNKKCAVDDDCGPGFFCHSDKVCKAGCRFSVECLKGEVCKVNQCLPVQEDKDKDGFPAPLDCKDDDPLVNPGVQEICGNKKDDNCNGVVDEEGCVKVECKPGTTRSCYDGKESTLTFKNTPCKKGNQLCNSDGVWGDCQGQILPAAEDCDSLDSDCDGKVDEDSKGGPLKRSCYNADPSTRGVGSCRDGVQTCKDGKWSDCVDEVQPKDEVCNGKDDDCDGKVDDLKEVGQSCTTDQKGICAPGSKVCDPKQKKIICQSDEKPVKENCGDKLDNDCDGIIDNGCPFASYQVGKTSGFPHYIAVSDKWVALSLKDADKVSLFERKGTGIKAHKDINLKSTPYGLQFYNGALFVANKDSLLKYDPLKASLSSTISLPHTSNEGQVLLQAGRALTRYWGKDKDGKVQFGLCRVDLSTEKVNCSQTQEDLNYVGQGLGSLRTYGILLSDKGLLFVDTLSLKEDSKRRLSLAAQLDRIAVDDLSQRAVVTSEQKKKVYILDLKQERVLAALSLTNENNQQETPGAVIIAGDDAFVTHRDGRSVSMFNLQSFRFVRRLEVGLGPLGLTIGSADSVKGFSIWVACAGDNTIWQFQSPP